MYVFKLFFVANRDAQNVEGAQNFRGANAGAVSPMNFHISPTPANNWMGNKNETNFEFQPQRNKSQRGLLGNGVGGHGKSGSVIRNDANINENLASTLRKGDPKYNNNESNKSLTSTGSGVGNETNHSLAASVGRELMKSGYIKKASGSKIMPSWKTKMVEVRYGTLIYEEEDGLLGQKLGQKRTKKVIPLEAGRCVVQDIPSKKKNEFEIVSRSTINSSSTTIKRQWKATNESEKEEWLKIIESAMIPDPSEVDDFDFEYAYSMMLIAPYIKEIERYKELKNLFSSAEEREEYMKVVSIMSKESLMVPTAWLQMVEGNGSGATSNFLLSENNGAGGRIALANFIAGDDIEQMWKDMKRDTVSINGSLLHGDSCGPEAIVGMLTRAIMDTAKTAKPGNHLKAEKIKPSVNQPISLTVPTLQQLHEMTEVQALIYTITILLAGNRTSSGGSTYLAVENLCRNSDLVILCPYSQESEPLQISVSLEYEEEMEETIQGNEDNEISCTLPNDETKKGMTDGKNSTLPGSSEDEDTYIPDLGTLTAKDRVRATQSMRFHGKDLAALQANLQLSEKKHLKSFDRSPTHRRIQSSSASLNSFDINKQSNPRTDISSTPLESELISGMKEMNLKPKSKPMIKTTIIANSYYRVCPNDPQDENDDLWCIIAARFCQTFTISASGLDSRPEQVFVKVIEAKGEDMDVVDRNSENKEDFK